MLTSRVHPGETGASWMIHGVIDTLLNPKNDEEKELDSFINYWNQHLYMNTAYVPSDENAVIESHFMKFHDAERFGILACNCCEYIFTYKPTSSLFTS